MRAFDLHAQALVPTLQTRLRSLEVVEQWHRLEGIPKGHPDFFEWPSTETRRGESRINAGEWEATGMLGYLGYRVGKTSELSGGQRQAVLNCAFVSHLPPLNSPAYMRSWGAPLSLQRLRRMAESIAAFVRLRKQRRNRLYEDAIREWEDDLRFLHDQYYAGRFRFSWPSV